MSNLKQAPWAITPALVERLVSILPVKEPVARAAPGVVVPFAPRATARFPDWTADEDDQLRAAYAKGERIDALAEELGRTHRAAMSRAQKLGLSGSHPMHGGWCKSPVWTADDDRRLREGYGTVPTAQLARSLGRGVRAVFSRAFRLGLDHGYHKEWTGRHRLALRIAFERGIAIADVAAALGRKAFSASKYASNHGYEFGRRPLLVAPISLEQLLALADPSMPVPANRRDQQQAQDAAAREARAVEIALKREEAMERSRRRAIELLAPKSGSRMPKRPAVETGEAQRKPKHTGNGAPASVAQGPRPATPPAQAAEETAAPVTASPRPVEARPPRYEGIGGLERLARDAHAARAHLERRGFMTGVVSFGLFWCQGWRGQLTPHDLIAFAIEHGWEQPA